MVCIVCTDVKLSHDLVAMFILAVHRHDRQLVECLVPLLKYLGSNPARGSILIFFYYNCYLKSLFCVTILKYKEFIYLLQLTY